MISFIFLSPLGERLGEGVQGEGFLLHHPLTQPLPQGGEEHDLWHEKMRVFAYSAATAIACFRPGMVKPRASSLAIMSLPAFSSASTSGGRTGVQAASLP